MHRSIKASVHNSSENINNGVIGNKIIISNKLVNITNLSTTEKVNPGNNEMGNSAIVRQAGDYIGNAAINSAMHQGKGMHSSSKVQTVQVVPPTIVTNYLPTQRGR